MDYYIYIMASNSGTLYIGITNNLLKRVFEHKFEHKKDINEGFTEHYKDVKQAITREKQIKSGDAIKRNN